MSQSAYISGDFWRICDRCGFRFRSSMTQRTWDGLYVCRDDFETRHPQDFVRGRVDNQTAPNPRPEPITSLVGPLTTELSVAASPTSTTLTLGSSIRFAADDNIGVVCDDGMVRAVTVHTVPTSTTVTLTSAFGASSAIGNIVINYSAVAEVDIG